MSVLFAVLFALGSPATAADPASAAAALYKAECLTCHGAKGDGKGPAAIALKPKPPSFADPGFWVTRTDVAVGNGIRNGKVGTGMPAWPNLSEAELAELVKYLHSFSP